MRQLEQPSTMLIKNSTNRDKLRDDILKGVIYYQRGYFKGQFSAQTTIEMKRLHGVWSVKEQGFRVEREKIPYPIQQALLNSDVGFTVTLERIFAQINKNVEAEFVDQIPLDKIFQNMVYKMDDEVRSSVETVFKAQAKKNPNAKIAVPIQSTQGTTDEIGSANFADQNNVDIDGEPDLGKAQQTVKETLNQITVQPKISPELAKKLADPYVGQIRAAIKDWTEEKMTELRGEIQQSVLAGRRYESIVSLIQTKYQQAPAKAKFLARQETNLMTVKIKEDRFKRAGVTRYKWRCVVGSPNHPVRDMHKIHDGKEFSFDDPPIVNKKGDRKNPGEDYNCRCTAVPIVRFDDEESY